MARLICPECSNFIVSSRCIGCQKTTRQLGINQRALGTNPRALGTNPRARRRRKRKE